MASEGFLAQVRLLMRVLPLLGGQEALALKGGTTINLLVQNLPRLSVNSASVFQQHLQQRRTPG